MDPALAPAVSGTPRVVLRIEGFALFALATAGFASAGLIWWLYAALFLAPERSLAAYGAGPRAGAAAYHALHTRVSTAFADTHLGRIGWTKAGT